MNQTKPPRNGVFTNNYPKRVTNDIIKTEKKKTNTNDEHATTTNDEHTNTNDDPTNTNDDPLTPTQKHHQQSSQWHYLMLVTKEKRSSTKRESISTKPFQTPTPPKSKSYTTKKTRLKIHNQRPDERRTPTQRRLPCKMSWPTTPTTLDRRNADSSSAWKNTISKTSSLVGWLWNHLEGLQVELQTPNQWSASYQRKSSRFEHSERHLPVEYV